MLHLEQRSGRELCADGQGLRQLRGEHGIVAGERDSRPGGAAVNVAAQANGGIASACVELQRGYPGGAVNDGDRKGVNWGSGGGWNDASANVWPDWVQIDFAGTQTIDEIDVFTSSRQLLQSGGPYCEHDLHAVWRNDLRCAVLGRVGCG